MMARKRQPCADFLNQPPAHHLRQDRRRRRPVRDPACFAVLHAGALHAAGGSSGTPQRHSAIGKPGTRIVRRPSTTSRHPPRSRRDGLARRAPAAHAPLRPPRSLRLGPAPEAKRESAARPLPRSPRRRSLAQARASARTPPCRAADAFAPGLNPEPRHRPGWRPASAGGE